MVGTRIYLLHESLSASVGLVLFVCVENTFRSVLSEALFNAAPPPGWRAESAGVQAAAAINPVVVDLLAEIGIRLGPKTPRTVTPELIAAARRYAEPARIGPRRRTDGAANFAPMPHAGTPGV